MQMLSFESIKDTPLWLTNCQSNWMKRTAAAATYDGPAESNLHIDKEAMSFRLGFEGSLVIPASYPAVSGMRATKHRRGTRLCANALPLIPLLMIIFPATVNAA